MIAQRPDPFDRPHVVRRMLARVAFQDEGCWEFRGATTHFGHGVLGRGARGQGNVLAHRVMWEWLMGPVPKGMCVLHHCDNPPCVRLGHLFLGTRADNNRDMWAKGRGALQRDPDYLIRSRGQVRAGAVA